jgi:hypothetical protein
MSFGQIIKGTILPKVPLKTLSEEDSSSDGSTNKDVAYKARKSSLDTSQRTGVTQPFIKIGGQIVKGIEMMTIDETGFIPRISMTFTDEFGEFGGDYFPKTDIVMSVYLRASSEKFKPIRCDFLITNVTSIPRGDVERRSIGMGTTYTVKGELYIPNIYNNISRSYGNVNSKDVLKKVCDELGLGFAENESSPNDQMTWINSNMSSLQFMQHVIDHSYQDDDAFFTGFIDKYYYLNYVEVNRQLLAEELDVTFSTYPNPAMAAINQKEKENGVSAELEEQTVTNYLTTEASLKDSSNYIKELSLLSNHGEIIKKQGYKKNIYYYDHLRRADEPKAKFIDFFMSPLKSIDRQPDNFLIPNETSLAENKIKKWMNIDYGNAHPEWNAARLTNSHNLKELEKVKLKVTIDNVYYQSARGFTVPVYVSIRQAEKVFKSNESQLTDNASKQELDKEAPDRQLSGYYYISGAKYHFDRFNPKGLYTELFLARREWLPSKIIDPNA